MLKFGPFVRSPPETWPSGFEPCADAALERVAAAAALVEELRALLVCAESTSISSVSQPVRSAPATRAAARSRRLIGRAYYPPPRAPPPAPDRPPLVARRRLRRRRRRARPDGHRRAGKAVDVVADEYSFDPETIVLTGGGELELELENERLPRPQPARARRRHEIGGTPTFSGGQTRSGTVTCRAGRVRARLHRRRPRRARHDGQARQSSRGPAPGAAKPSTAPVAVVAALILLYADGRLIRRQSILPPGRLLLRAARLTLSCKPAAHEGRTPPIWETERSMRSIWKGTISFGLVNIPIALGVATQRSDPKFRTLDAETGPADPPADGLRRRATTPSSSAPRPSRATRSARASSSSSPTRSSTASRSSAGARSTSSRSSTSTRSTPSTTTAPTTSRRRRRRTSRTRCCSRR